MADEENNSSKVVTELSKIKDLLISLNPMTIGLVRRTLEDMKQANPDLAPEIANLIKSIEEALSKLEESGKSNARIAGAQETITQEAEEIKQVITHQHRLRETKALQQDYDSFKDDFVKKLRDNNALLKKAVNGEELSEDEKAQLTCTPRNEIERREFKRLDEEKAARWKAHYKLKDNYGKLIIHSENKIKKHQEELEENIHPPERVEEINSLIDAEKKQITQHKESLKKLSPVELEREEERKIFLEAIQKGKIDKVLKSQIETHINIHKSDYNSEISKNPNYMGKREIIDISQKVGLSDKLEGLSKEQSNSSRVQRAESRTGQKISSNLVEEAQSIGSNISSSKNYGRHNEAPKGIHRVSPNIKSSTQSNLSNVRSSESTQSRKKNGRGGHTM